MIAAGLCRSLENQVYTMDKPSIRQRVVAFWRMLQSPLRRLFSILLVVGILFGAWYGFLAIVAPPPIDTTSALIMVWLSAAILCFALFPSIWDRVKKFKVKDFELELQDAVTKAATKDIITVPRIDEHTFSQKGTFPDLARILGDVTRAPSKPVLLVVNLRQDDFISIPMLLIYLSVLDLVGSSTTVLFISSTRNARRVSEIRAGDIVGAVPGKVVLRTFYAREPRFFHMLHSQGLAVLAEEFWRSGRISDDRLDNVFDDIYQSISDSDTQEHLSQGQVRSWFSGELSTCVVQAKLTDSDVQTIHEAIVRGDEYLLIIENERLNAVITLCSLTTNVTKNLLNQATAK